ncbi:hypothetical protein VTJ49DRAFT_2416 [Mycothermus thermophilus]|uniref:Uncharacterized protein n=1 Tax=Humicola insolens TaxID=85995 RepID=A0ABR3VAN0_HUMIN
MGDESASSLFPTRPIRPLPKRRLRERLSPEVADSIQYPPVPQSTPSLFSYPYPLTEERADPASTTRETGSSHPDPRQAKSNGVATEPEADIANGNSGVGSTAQHGELVSRPKADQSRYSDSLLGASAASSADGYDLFENTNNKKRKIPTAGDSAPGGVHGLSESNVGAVVVPPSSRFIEGQETTAPASTSYYTGSLTSSAHNVPGPGRGRFGRPRSGKSPLRPLYDSTNSWARRTAKARGQWSAGTGESTGIISNAIANAEKLPAHPGQENISLLQQSTKRSPATTQFTFTCEQVPSGLTWPGSDRRISPMSQQTAGAAAQNKENWPRASQAAATGHVPPPAPPSAEMGSKDAHSRNGVSGAETPHATPPRKSTRRRTTKSYLVAAEERRRATQLYNKRHPPKPDEIWICHFCEYEWIFGHPPEALVRAYEIKERKQKQLEEQRRAQWERMKKGKHKGKKNSKLPNKNSHAGAQDNMHHHADTRGGMAGDHHHYGHGGHGEEEEEYYDEDEYYDDEEYDVDDEDEIVEQHAGHGHGHVHPGHHQHHGSSHGSAGSFSGGSVVAHDGGGT